MKWTLGLFTFLLLVCLCVSQYDLEDQCEDEEDEESINFALMDRPRHTRIRNAEELRVATLESYDLETRDDSKEIMKNVIQPAIEEWKKYLQPIYPLTRNLRVKRKCEKDLKNMVLELDGTNQEYCTRGCAVTTECGKTVIPKHLLSDCREYVNNVAVNHNNAGQGLPHVDFLLIVNVFQSKSCLKATRAHTVICEIDPVSSRPIVASLNLCPKLFRAANTNYSELVDTALHELAHAFGFSRKAFAFMMDENGQPRTDRDPHTQLPTLGFLSNNIYKPSTSTLGYFNETYVSAYNKTVRSVPGLTTPRLLEAARNYTGCSTLHYVHLEGQKCTGSHFEKRIYNGELMVASRRMRRVISPLILAYFEDSGWYHVNYTGATKLTWGNLRGCDFVFKSCYEYQFLYQKQHATSHPWCYERSPACSLIKHKDPLPQEYRYFKSLPGVPQTALQFYGGPDKYMDYCPYYKDMFCVGWT